MNFLEDIQKLFIICSNEDKNRIIDFISHSDKIYNVHFFTMSELKKKLFFDYSKRCIYETAKYLGVKPSVAKVYIDNLYYVEDKKYNNKKLDGLVALKKYLDEKNLLIYDTYFTKYIHNKNFVVYNFSYLTKFQSKMLDKLKEWASVSFYKEEKKSYHPIVYHASTLEEEVEFVVNKIGDLLQDGVDIHKIKLVNVDSDYDYTLSRLFRFYHIPINQNITTNLLSTVVGREFIMNYQSDISKTIAILKEKYGNSDVINKIISICNNYNFVKDYNLVKDCILFDMKNTSMIQKNYKDAVDVVSIDSIAEDDYVFMMNFNQNKIPKFKKDEDFITDNIKYFVDLEPTYEENKKIASKIKMQILNIKNLVITYKDKSTTGSFYPSSLIQDLNLEVKEASYLYKYSTLATKIKLAKKIDKLLKFGTKDNDMDLLYNTIPISYNTYDNCFTGIDKNMFYDSINKELKLSYSTLDNYNRCAFKYYLTSVLKLDIYEDTFVTFIGSLFHFILEKGLTDEIDIEKEVSFFIKRSERVLSVKEEFLLEKLIGELHFIITTIKEQLEHSKLKDMLFENKIEIRKDRDISVVFKGFIDKICFKKIGDKTVVAIIDYKTGNTSIDLKNSIYGIGMQLPIYLYLASNYEKIENAYFAGFYLQRILSEEVLIDEEKSLEEIKKNNLKLNGFSNSDQDLLELFDDSYEDSKVISGMGLYKNGNFKTKKVLTNEQINHLISLTERVVDHTIDHILDANFSINPKQVGDNVKDRIGCDYCKFKDICFVNNKNFVKLKKQEDLSFLEEGEKDA